MSASIIVKLDTRKLDQLAASLNMETDRVIHSAALQVEAEAKVRAPYITGALMNSIHTDPKGNKTYWVADAVEYGARIEFGFHDVDSLGRRYNQAARPFMMPAVEKVRKQLDKMFAEIVK